MATDDVHDLLRELCRGITLRLLPASAPGLVRHHVHGQPAKRGMIARDPDELESLIQVHGERQTGERPIIVREPVCAICGESTEGASGVFRAWLELEYEFGTMGECAWAHEECFARCTETGQQRGIPW